VQPLLLQAGDKDQAFKLDQQVYVPLTVLQAATLSASLSATDGEFTIEGLKNEFGAISVWGADDAQEAISSLPLNEQMDMVLLELNTVAALDTDKLGVPTALAGDSRYAVDFANADIDPSSMKYGSQTESGFYVTSSQNPGRQNSDSRPIPVISMVLQNENDFAPLHVTPEQSRPRRIGSDLPHDADFFDRFNGIGKALTGAQLDEFNRNHPRNEDGEFAPKAGKFLPPSDAKARRAQRQQRHARKRKRIQAAKDRRTVLVGQQTQQIQAKPSEATQASGRADSVQRGVPDRSTATVARRDANRATVSRESQRRSARMYPQAEEGRDSGKYDFAGAAAIMLDEVALIEVFGRNGLGETVEPDMMWDPHPESVLDATPITSGPEILGDVAAWSRSVREPATQVRPAQSEPRAYETHDAAMEAAMTYISELSDTDVVWGALVSQEDFGGETIYYPKMIGYEPNETQTIIFATPEWMASLYESGPDPSKLTMIDADSFEDLLALRSDDSALQYIETEGHRANPALRAFWYGDRDD